MFRFVVLHMTSLAAAVGQTDESVLLQTKSMVFEHSDKTLKHTDNKAVPCFLQNEVMRFGSGNEDSFVERSLDLNQPFYMSESTNVFTKLTYSNNALKTEVHISGTKVTPACGVQDASEHTPGTGAGTGTLKMSCDITDGVDTWTIESRLGLEPGSRTLEIAYSVTPHADTTSSKGIEVWIGTPDDWVGTTDDPTKVIGDFNNAGIFFEGGIGPADGGRAIKVFSSTEGIFFSGTGDTKAIMSPGLNWNAIVAADPFTQAASSMTNDGSYALRLKLGVDNALRLKLGGDNHWPASTTVVGGVSYKSMSAVELADAIATPLSDEPVIGPATPVPTPAPASGCTCEASFPICGGDNYCYKDHVSAAALSSITSDYDVSTCTGECTASNSAGSLTPDSAGSLTPAPTEAIRYTQMAGHCADWSSKLHQCNDNIITDSECAAVCNADGMCYAYELNNEYDGACCLATYADTIIDRDPKSALQCMVKEDTTVEVTGDPHMRNLDGEVFDLSRAGQHVLIQIPLGSGEKLEVIGTVTAFHKQRKCPKYFMTELKMKGSMVGEEVIQIVSDREHFGVKLGAAAEFLNIDLTNYTTAGVAQVQRCNEDNALCRSTGPGRRTPNYANRLLVQLPSSIKIVASNYASANPPFMNLAVSGLAAQDDVGGLLGHDDHSMVAGEPECDTSSRVQKISMLQREHTATVGHLTL